MKNAFIQLFNEMETLIDELPSDTEINLYTNRIQIVENILERLREIVHSSIFKNDDDEIHYFKNLKPTIISRLILYKRMLQIEYEKPHGAIEDKIDHLECELKRLNRYCKANAVFVKYIRSGRTHLDQEYFLRRNAKVHQMYETFASEIDYTTGTGFDYRLAVLLAHDQIENFIQEKIDALKNPNNNNKYQITSQHDSQLGIKKIKWTLSNSNFVELIYGLNAVKAFNNGTASIMEIKDYFEKEFNVKISNPYRTFYDIKNRKSMDRFTFLSTMIDNLEQLADEDLNPN